MALKTTPISLSYLRKRPGIHTLHWGWTAPGKTAEYLEENGGGVESGGEDPERLSLLRTAMHEENLLGPIIRPERRS